MNIYRQGDVLLKEIEKLPGGANKSKSLIIAYGEVTGHSHRIVDGDVYEHDNKLLVVAGNLTEIVHEEHRPFRIEKGVYEISNEREFDYFDNELRKVVD